MQDVHEPSPLSLLLVEDNEDDALLLQEELDEVDGEWFHLDRAERLSSGLDKLSQKTFDVVLLDLTLPDSHGLATIHRVRREFPQVPIIVVSSHDDEGLLASALAEGIQDYVVKGTFDGPTLGRSIWYAIRRHRAELERVRLEARLQMAQKVESLSVLAGGLAHDFNNILMGILGNAEMLLIELGADSPFRERVSAIATGATRASELTTQLMAYAGKAEVAPRPLDLNEMLEETERLVRTLVSKNGDVRWALSEDIPEVEADPMQLQQVAMNLVINASEALGKDGGIVEISTGTAYVGDGFLARCHHDGDVVAGTYVYFQITDSGCGIDDETKAHLFDPFYTTKSTGRGLGLAAVLGIIARHGGAISVTSSVGEGSSFRVLLPRARTKSTNVVPERRPAVLRRGGTVLVVDDEASVRSVISETLQRFGVHVMTARDGQQALSLHAESGANIDVVVLDVTMPKMDGPECFRELRKRSPELPIVLMSGYDEEDTAAALGHGDEGTRFLQKPFRTRDLLETIAYLAED